MAQRRLFWHFYLWFLIITLLSIAVFSFYASRTFSRFFLSHIRNDLQVRAKILAELVEPDFTAGHYDRVDEICKQTGVKANVRVTVILTDGKVIGDSERNPVIMDNHRLRPEIIEATENGFGVNSRFSKTLKSMLMYAAVNWKTQDGNSFVIRTSVQVDMLDLQIRSMFIKIGQFGLIIAAVLALISLAVSRHISRPIELINEGAQKFAKGELTGGLILPKNKELASLTITLNQMADELNQRIETISSQRNLLETILSSMSEGVIAIDKNGIILSVNNAACELLGINKSDIEMKKNNSIEEILRDAEIQQFVKDSLYSDSPIELEMVFGEKREKFLHVYGRKLGRFDNSGAVVVFNEITRLRQLENIRRDFVANVSHELKTPITSIKGFVETLLDGAIENKEDAHRFLEIIKRHSDRLTAIIEDLLLLCRLQEQGQDRKIRLEIADIKKCIESAVQTCSGKAKEKNISIVINAEPIPAKVDAFLIEQAFVNLIDNAIKYSESDKEIKIVASQDAQRVTVDFIDNGFGIASEHIERIFERFYVTDNARSRNLGGTGLGLSIVKHICQAHGGSVEVKSQLGKGSDFTMILPKNL